MLTPDLPILRDVETPALVVDHAALSRNVAHMASRVKAAGLGLRPHSKTHKSPDVARMQKAAGAVGVCCATVREAEAMVAAGIDGVLITAPTIGAANFARIAAMNRVCRIAVAVDHLQQVDGLAAALQAGDPPLAIMIDIDIGQARTGVISPADALTIAGRVAQADGLTLLGVQGYAGHVQHIPEAGSRREAAEKASAILGSYTQAMTGAGFKPGIVSGSGTGAHRLDMAHGPYTEIQAGSYVFMDADYARIHDELGRGPDFEPSLFVLGTVVSVNRPGEITVDAGTKSLATNGPMPCVMRGVPDGSVFRFGGDEHGIISVPAGTMPPPLGSRVLIGATHCDPTVNLHDRYHVVRDGALETWRVMGRYGG